MQTNAFIIVYKMLKKQKKQQQKNLRFYSLLLFPNVFGVIKCWIYKTTFQIERISVSFVMKKKQHILHLIA